MATITLSAVMSTGQTVSASVTLTDANLQRLRSGLLLTFVGKTDDRILANALNQLVDTAVAITKHREREQTPTPNLPVSQA